MSYNMASFPKLQTAGENIETRDFSQPQPIQSPTTRGVHYDLESGSEPPQTGRRRSSARPESPTSPAVYRRRTRADTFRSTKSAHTTRASLDQAPPYWQPGQEPGLDPSKVDGGRPDAPTLHAECQITVVDFSETNLEMHDFDNAGFVNFIAKPQADWIKCRWISVNGLSWDVIQALGVQKRLHRLAIEDLVHLNNRTKADWYSDHTYLVLTLQKLIHLHPDDEEEGSESGDAESFMSVKPKRRRLQRWMKKQSTMLFAPKYNEKNMVGGVHDPYNGFVKGHTDGIPDAPVQKLRTLQRYHGGKNHERMAYMEAHSPLTAKKMAVSAEQVSIFLTADNCLICFFESSADDIEAPILHRLNQPDTVLRRSCDASLVMQAVMDAVIDLAIPVADAYVDAIGDLELEVLTEPSIKQSKDLYIITSEINMMRNQVAPIASVIAALRDHKSMNVNQELGGRGGQANTAVKVSATSLTYLGDVEDHILLMTEALDQMRRSCDNMIDLIFNTISAYQNERVKQLTIVTIIFLPLTFLTGYFGMNIEPFPALQHGETYFWKIAIPVGFVTTVFLMRDFFVWWIKKVWQRRGINQSRKGRKNREAARRKRDL